MEKGSGREQVFQIAEDGEGKKEGASFSKSRKTEGKKEGTSFSKSRKMEKGRRREPVSYLTANRIPGTIPYS
jgi:hypothetical protein